MNVAQCVESYIERKKLCGYDYYASGRILRRFAHFVGRIDISRVSETHINAFLGRGRLSNSVWRGHRSLLRSFFVYWFARQLTYRIPEPQQKPKVATDFFPYIYSRTEIRRLLRATAECQVRRECVITAETLRTMVLFLYGTGTKIIDALALTDADIDLENNCIELRSGSLYYHRTIPIGSDVRLLLERHLRETDREYVRPRKALFLTTKSQPIPYGILRQTFARLRIIANVSRANSSFQPRIQDLRHTFAVHSITNWIRKGLSFERMLPMLTMYMGNVNEMASEKYLDLTPPRFRPQLNRLRARLRQNEITLTPGQDRTA